MISPWISVADATRAIAFYRDAFGATEREKLESEPGTVEVAQLALADGATFWIARDEDARGATSIRLLVEVGDPDAAFARAIAAGATEIAAPHTDHGWRSGRIADPFGHHWELAKRV